MKRMMIIGSTSGIGKALAEHSLSNGYLVGGLGRNLAPLQALKENFPQQFVWQQADIRQTADLPAALERLADKMGGMDICVVAASISGRNPQLQFDIEQDVLQTNVVGYAAVLIWAANYFCAQKSGHLVGITSLAKFLAVRHPSYTATKAFEGRYLDGLRLRLKKDGVTVSEIMPGFVRTPMTEGRQTMFWAISPSKAAACILKAIERKRMKVVLPARWKPFYWLLPHIPRIILQWLPE